MDKIKIFDTTLRDGEQSPGASMHLKEKIEVAKALESLKVDIIEAGFPITSPGDFESVQAISEAVKDVTVTGLARCVEGDIKRAGDAVRNASRPRIHVFCATSAIHRKYKLKRAQDEIVKLSVDAVKLARSMVDDVEFSPEDASRTELEFLRDVVTAVTEAGARTVNIPDTVGYATPEQFAHIFSYLRETVPGIEKVTLSTHCHDDLGLAVANSLAAVRAGARQVECTVNGIGERAGNASLEEIVMAIKTRADYFQCKTRVNTTKIFPISRMVATMTGIHVQRNKAIVGENAFAHEAGIHQDGMLKHRDTYEIMRPQDVGIPESRLVMGKHSGRHALRERYQALGHQLSDAELDVTYDAFKKLADKKKDIFDEDLEALIDSTLIRDGGLWQLEKLQVTTGEIPTASVTLRDSGGMTVTDAAAGDGPIDAIYSVIQRITHVNAKLKDYQIRAVTGGKDAQGEVTVELQHHDRKVRGRGYSTDIIEASARAYLAAINRIAVAATDDKDVGAENP